jgi:hypothetical protein
MLIGHSPVFLGHCWWVAPAVVRTGSLDQRLKGIHVSAVVAGTVDWRLGDEGGVGQAEVIEQNAEGLFPDHSRSDVLVAVELGAAGGFGVVAVDYFHVIQADGFVQLCQRPVKALFADDVVSAHVGVTGVDAGCDGHDVAQALDYFRDLLEAASEGEFGPGGVFDQNGQASSGEVEALCGSGDGSGCAEEALLAVGSAELTWVKDKILRAER